MIESLSHNCPRWWAPIPRLPADRRLPSRVLPSGLVLTCFTPISTVRADRPPSRARGALTWHLGKRACSLHATKRYTGCHAETQPEDPPKTAHCKLKRKEWLPGKFPQRCAVTQQVIEDVFTGRLASGPASPASLPPSSVQTCSSGTRAACG